MTSDRAADQWSVADAAFEAALDRDFGSGYLTTLLAAALTAGIETLRRSDGSLDIAESTAFVEYKTGLTVSAPGDGDPRDRDATNAWIEHWLDYEVGFDVLEELVALIGETCWLVTADSSGFAVMTASSYTIDAVCRNGRVATIASGSLSIEMHEGYYLQDRGLDDDPEFRVLRLDAVSRFGGLGPGVSVPVADDLDPELREMTLEADEFDGWWRGTIEFWNLDEFIESHLEDVAETTNQSPEATRDLLQRLLAGEVPSREPERAVLWSIWKDIRVT